jgi:hypothetical protein
VEYRAEFVASVGVDTSHGYDAVWLFIFLHSENCFDPKASLTSDSSASAAPGLRRQSFPQTVRSSVHTEQRSVLCSLQSQMPVDRGLHFFFGQRHRCFEVW